MDEPSRRRDFACRCHSAPRRRPPKPEPYPDCGYIVERVVDSFREEVCYEGELRVCGLPDHLCPPLTLRALDIICVEPVCAPGPPISQPPGTNRLAVTCCAWVSDSRGCRAQGETREEISVSRAGPPNLCGLKVRRGGQVQLLHACFCSACTFSVCLRICVQTILSRHEMLGRRPPCPPPCPNLPLYPPPVCPMPRDGFCGCSY